jgi:3',5'-cyclic AMP phosphodiesterase CpdA
MMQAPRGVLLALTLLAVSGLTQATVAALPEQFHVTLSESGGLVVQWAVVGAPYGSQDLPWVAYRIEGGPWQYEEGQLSGVVLQSSTGAPAAGADSAYHYSATINVPAGAKVEYKVGSTQRPESNTFTVRNVPGLDQPLRFVAYGDIGVDNTGVDGGSMPGINAQTGTVRQEAPTHVIRDLALRQNPDLWVIPGDLAYDNSGLGWSKFMRFAQPLQATVVTMPSAGNHEWDDGNAAGYSQFLNAYVLPGDEQFYSYKAGPVTFLVANSDAFCGPGRPAGGSPQEPCYGTLGRPPTVEWFEQELASAKADETPWTIVYFHHPVWSWGRHGSSIALQTMLAPLFEKYGVDAIITAHDHLYSRTHQLQGSEVMATGSSYSKGVAPLYVVVGGGGRALYNLPAGEPPAWHAASAKVHHLSVWDVNATTLSMRVLDGNGSLVDEFEIVDRGVEARSQSTEGAPVTAAIALIAIGAALVALRRRSTL